MRSESSKIYQELVSFVDIELYGHTIKSTIRFVEEEIHINPISETFTGKAELIKHEGEYVDGRVFDYPRPDEADFYEASAKFVNENIDEILRYFGKH